MYVVCSVSYPILKPLIMSFCTQGLLGVAESTAPLREGPPSPWGEGARQDVRGCEKMFRLALTHHLRRSPLSPCARVMLEDGFCDFAFSSAQNDRMGSIMLRMKVFKLEKPN